MLKRIGALLKIIAPLSDPPSEKMHRLKYWSPPGIEPRSMAWNAIYIYIYIYIYIPGGPEITEQSIQSIFQDFALINCYFLRLVG